MKLVTIDSILELIPQRPPMVMVDSIISSNDEFTKSSFFVNNNSIFFENGKLNEAGLIENIAQTAACGMGFRNKHNNEKIRIGFVGAIKNLIINFLPIEGEEIVTTVQIVSEVLNALIIFGKVEQNDEIAIECEMKIFLNEE